MNELPRGAKELLALARLAESSPVEAKERVRSGVAFALAGSVAPSVSALQSAQAAKLKAGFLSTLHGKIALVSGIAMLIGAGAFVLLRAHEPAPRSAAAERVDSPEAAEPKAPLVAPPESTPSTAVPIAPALPARAKPIHKARATESVASSDSLRTEMTMLHEASVALDRGELETAAARLEAHRTQYPNGQLSQERQGLQVLARCMANEASSASAARAYLRSAPQGVLFARVERACLTQDEQ